MKKQQIFKLTSILFLINLFSQTNAFTYECDRYFINPGLKIGHTFGEKGGFTIGFELSYTITTSKSNYGFVASVDYCVSAKRMKYFLGAEYFFVSAGPTFITEDESVDIGINVTLYYGLIIIPYISQTFRFAKHDLVEAGSFLKFPILVNGPSLITGGGFLPKTSLK
ncbi:MAG: hypothetical protein HYZ34_12040 [Ignavibacteriae bacterium]|nr:hypothetical protein [Ignavibacteriota bacterium]